MDIAEVMITSGANVVTAYKRATERKETNVITLLRNIVKEGKIQEFCLQD